MTKTISRISPGPAAKVLLLIHLVLGAIGTAIGFVAFYSQERVEPYSGLWPMIPIIYATGGFLITFSGVLVYNLIAKFLGGIRIEYSDS
jgi:hypothetical protein